MMRLLPLPVCPAGWSTWTMPNGLRPAYRYHSTAMTAFTVTASREHLTGEDAPLGIDGIWRRIVISRPNRYPGWDEMRDFVRSCGLFDRDRDVAMLIPPDNEYVNAHQYAFHWWQREGGPT